MRAPAGLTPAARRPWRQAAAAIEQIGRDPEPLAPVLALYAAAAGRLRELEASWRGQGAEMTSKGSAGQRTVAPEVVEMRQLEAHVAQLAERLGLVMPARAGGWQLGRARSPDRQFSPRARKVIPFEPVQRLLDEHDARSH